jgi:SAM-dependent methyltransferase
MSAEDRDRWDLRYRTRGPESTAPSDFLTSLDDVLPRRGRALDVAGGAGRNAVWLARRGLEVTVADVSGQGLALARAAAAEAGVTLDLVLADLEVDPLPPGPFDVVVSFNFLRRPLFAAFPRVMSPGGLLVYRQPTRSNLIRHSRPPAAFLLDDGELPRLVQGLEVLRYEEGWFPGDAEGPRHEARLLGRVPSSQGP